LADRQSRSRVASRREIPQLREWRRRTALLGSMRVSTRFARDVQRRRDELVERAREADGDGELFTAVSSRLRRLVPFDIALWLPADPDTGMPSGPARAENLDTDHHRCMAYFRAEFFGHDVNLFRDLARAASPAATLLASTYDHPARSVRYRDWLRPQGLRDELRVVLRVDDRPWGSMVLFREAGRRPFDAEETALLASLAAPLAERLRARSAPLPAAAERDEPAGPGLMLFDGASNLISANDDAHGWLGQLPAGLSSETPLGIELPSFVSGAIVRAQAVAAGRDPGPARTRLRTRSGRWLVCHATALREADGTCATTALVIEPAPAAETAPLTAQALGLTAREQEIADHIARGTGTAQIAAALFLSRHTVRDHLKAIFAKADVSSRGELVARLYAEPPSRN
jgi:DNA-binding CsgD family transcriptional regulator